MSLKHEFDATEFEALPEYLKAGYEQSEEGTYVAKEDFKSFIPDDSGLKNKNKELHGKLNQAKSESRDKDSQIARLEEIARQFEAMQEETGDKTNFESRYKGLEKKLTERDSAIQSLQNENNELKGRFAEKEVSLEANKVIAKLTSDPVKAALWESIVKNRLAYEEDGIKVKDSDGNISIDSVDDLIKELSSAEQYAPILDGGKGSGGGASGSQGNHVTNKDYSQMTDAEKVQALERNPDAFK